MRTLTIKLIPLVRKGGVEGVVCTTLHFEVLELLGMVKLVCPCHPKTRLPVRQTGGTQTGINKMKIPIQLK